MSTVVSTEVASNDVAIQLESVAKQYRGPNGMVRALSDISLVIERGSSLAITGPSGCGKSTLLSLIGGLEVPDSGRVMVGKSEISHLPERKRAQLRKRQFGFVFQSDNLLPFLTAVENVAQQFALRAARPTRSIPETGTPSTATRTLAFCYELLAAVGLNDHADKLPDQLSGGQRQRVAVVRALANLTLGAAGASESRARSGPPQILLADEPTGSLDELASASLVDFMLTAHRSVAATLVVVTHDPAVAERRDRTVGLEGGRLQFDTTMATSY
jgi:putative ABC transport system ATP-binding protein